MKKFCLLLLMVLGTLRLEALPVGNPSQPDLLTGAVLTDYDCPSPYCKIFDLISLEVGFYGDYVFNRYMEVDRSGSGSPNIQKTVIYTNAGYLGLTLCHLVEFFGTIGTTKVHLETPASSFQLGNNEPLFMESETDFSWSVGGRAIVIPCNCVMVGFEGQYFQSKPHYNWFRENDNAPLYLNDERLKYYEWQLSIGIAYHMSILCDALSVAPYAAFKFSRAKIDQEAENVALSSVINPPNLKSAKDWGYALGVSIASCKVWSLTAEARFADELAFHLNSIFSF